MHRTAKLWVSSVVAVAVMAVQIFGVNRGYWCPCHDDGEIVDTWLCGGGHGHEDDCHNDHHDDDHHGHSHSDSGEPLEWEHDHGDHHGPEPYDDHEHPPVRSTASYHGPDVSAMPVQPVFECLEAWGQPFVSLVPGATQEWEPRKVWEPWRSPPPVWLGVVRATVLMV